MWCFWCNTIDVFDEINENVNVNLKRCENFNIINLIVIVAHMIFDVIVANTNWFVKNVK